MPPSYQPSLAGHITLVHMDIWPFIYGFYHFDEDNPFINSLDLRVHEHVLSDFQLIFIKREIFCKPTVQKQTKYHSAVYICKTLLLLKRSWNHPDCTPPLTQWDMPQPPLNP